MTRTRLSALATTAALAASGGLLTATPAAAAVSCAAPVWKAEYYANATFTGTPRLTSCDSAIAENYGTGDPAGGRLPKDNFSVRWTVTRDFGSGGPFTLAAEAQDGIRVHVDGVRRIDLWKNVSTTQKKSVAVTIPAGRHTISVYYAAWTGAANVKFAYTPNTSATVDKVRPLAPTGATVAYDRTLNRATLKWAANKEMDHAGYRLYRRLPTTAWAKVSSAASLITGTSYVNSPPPTGASYLYELRAVDRAGNESWGGTDLTVATPDRTAPGAPTGLKAVENGTSGATLTWTAPTATDVAAYRVHVDGKLLDTVTATQFTQVWVDPGTTYRYTVSAVDKTGNVSAAAAATLTTDGDLVAPAPVTGLRATPREDGVLLEWTPNAEDDIKLYKVYRAEWYDDGEGGSGWIAYSTTVLGAQATSFLHGSVADGETVMYGVIAIDRWNNVIEATDPRVHWVEVTELGTPTEG
ncbi:fibronectin type III domain-containing protein [Streptomyces zaomyceticus]|uniref:fibronectin type III domain-containing protein n=1 Tax=Streptomyces zaomyceticus TaxID=68286 RepID=UPI002E1629F2|nr:PA14 domain-containing protein [Streptomyces zaomyceticus]